MSLGSKMVCFNSHVWRSCWIIQKDSRLRKPKKKGSLLNCMMLCQRSYIECSRTNAITRLWYTFQCSFSILCAASYMPFSLPEPREMNIHLLSIIFDMNAQLASSQPVPNAYFDQEYNQTELEEFKALLTRVEQLQDPCICSSVVPTWFSYG